jgi:SAM-dependent methyltransferase
MCIDAVHIASDPAAVFAELRRVLRPGGRAVVSNWEARDRDNDALPEWVRRVDCTAWLTAAGFTDVAMVEGPLWAQLELALFGEAANLDPGGDVTDERVDHLPAGFACDKYAAARRSTSFSCSSRERL